MVLKYIESSHPGRPHPVHLTQVAPGRVIRLPGYSSPVRAESNGDAGVCAEPYLLGAGGYWRPRRRPGWEASAVRRSPGGLCATRGPGAPGRLQGERPAASSSRETEGERSEIGAWTRRLLTSYHGPGTASRRRPGRKAPDSGCKTSWG